MNLLFPSDWQCKARTPGRSLADDLDTDEEWLAAHVPGTIHQDLLAARRIPDPFFGTQEREVQWVGETDWLYRSTFDLPVELSEAEHIMLCCHGLDTFATIWVNGTKVLESDNMFVAHRIPLRAVLHPGSNQLVILFESAVRRGRERETQYGTRVIWGEGDTSRVYVRKAQYHYGWDWGPTLITAGIWRPLYLEAYDIRIADLSCNAAVAPDLQQAFLPVQIHLEPGSNTSTDAINLELSLFGPAGKEIEQVTLPITGSEVRHTFELSSPQLWWPRGYGEQHLYSLVARLQQGEETLHWRDLRLGLRRLQLVQQPLPGEGGTSFCFEVNNKPIFCGGANWIPADSFTPRIFRERYRAWLRLAVEANMVMLRVWGGGIYEDDVFYDTCDELGLLVWQDFMFACGSYPAYDWFMKSVQTEAEQTVRRLRHHPCIALWCGNNEDYMVAGSMGAYDPAFAGDFTTTRFPARALYERLLPTVCKELDPDRPYWPGSPFEGNDANDPTQGDQHLWGVWHGNMADYHDYPTFGGRFISEFGMQAFPSLATIESFTILEERYPQSRVLDFHNKAAGGPRRLNVYLTDTVRIPGNLEDYIYATQFMQSEAITAGVRNWRRRWGKAGRRIVSGALVWQLNDCWPVTSWALVDYNLRPKPAYYTLRRELAPVAVRVVQQGAENADMWVVNATDAVVEAELEMKWWTLNGALKDEKRQRILLPTNEVAELGTVAFQQEADEVLAIRLVNDGEVIARATLWPEPFKYLTLPDPKITIKQVESRTFELTAHAPAKGVWLTAEVNTRWSDNMLDLMPGDPQRVVASQLDGATVKVRSLYQIGL